jgi:hypothetical protein
MLPAIPTGFGGYTGYYIQNRGDSILEYTVTIGDATVNSLAGGESPDVTKVFYISDVNDEMSPAKSTTFTLAPGKDQLLFAYYKPFVSVNNGVDYATVTINSTSYELGEADPAPSHIYLTGTRLNEASTSKPTRVGSFYSVREVVPSPASPTDTMDTRFTFFWKTRTWDNFVTGFKIETDDNYSFSSPTTHLIPVNQNGEANLPLYGNYSGLMDQEFTYSLYADGITSPLYARIKPMNQAGISDERWVICYGVNNYNPILGCSIINGFTGALDASFDATNFNLYNTAGVSTDIGLLNITLSNYTENGFDLYQYIKKHFNSNTDDFSFYSGVVVNFYNCKFYSKKSDETIAAINFQPPNEWLGTSSVAGYFEVILNFDNTNLYGFGGKAGTQTEDPEDGGSIFNFRNLNNIRYFVNKDTFSTFAVGGAGTIAATVFYDGVETQLKAGQNGLNGKNIKSIEPMIFKSNSQS